MKTILPQIRRLIAHLRQFVIALYGRNTSGISKLKQDIQSPSYVIKSAHLRWFTTNCCQYLISRPDILPSQERPNLYSRLTHCVRRLALQQTKELNVILTTHPGFSF